MFSTLRDLTVWKLFDTNIKECLLPLCNHGLHTLLDILFWDQFVGYSGVRFRNQRSGDGQNWLTFV